LATVASHFATLTVRKYFSPYLQGGCTILCYKILWPSDSEDKGMSDTLLKQRSHLQQMHCIVKPQMHINRTYCCQTSVVRQRLFEVFSLGFVKKRL